MTQNKPRRPTRLCVRTKAVDRGYNDNKHINVRERVRAVKARYNATPQPVASQLARTFRCWKMP
ncbi:hypothetical protein ACIUVY_004093, partial [Shigella flexneri]